MSINKQSKFGPQSERLDRQQEIEQQTARLEVEFEYKFCNSQMSNNQVP